MNRYKLICLYIHLFICIFNLNAQSVIQMKKEQGVFTVPCKVNGLPLKFILDTGASDVSLSLKEADYILKNGLLNDEDIIGSDYYQNATGSISVGVRVILREIIFGDIKITNVVASVVLSDKAPLLLGQSVLSRIGKYQIDPVNNTLNIFPNNSMGSLINSVRDIDGNEYSVVKIGNQYWMGSNLKVTKYNNGELIQKHNDNKNWANTSYGAYCYYENSKSNIKEYGNLYNWYAIIDSRGICPYGWHVPAKNEINTLIDFVKNENISTGALKDTIQWETPNLEAQNYLGFSARPGGKRWFNTGNYEFKTIGAYFWSSSSNSDKRAYYFAFSYDFAVARISHFSRLDGFSCRCIKD